MLLTSNNGFLSEAIKKPLVPVVPRGMYSLSALSFRIKLISILQEFQVIPGLPMKENPTGMFPAALPAGTEISGNPVEEAMYDAA